MDAKRSDPSNDQAPAGPETSQTAAEPSAETSTEARPAFEPDAPVSGPVSVDFRAPVVLATTQMRRLRLLHEECVRSLTTRFSIYFRMEFGVGLANLETSRFRGWLEQLPVPAHLTLFNLETVSGVGLLEMRPRLGLALVDRLLGGTGVPSSAERDLTEIETSVADEVIQILLRDWCSHWPFAPQVKPVLTGHETHGRFVQGNEDDLSLLVVSFQIRFLEMTELIRLAVPLSFIEPALQSLAAAAPTTTREPRNEAPPIPPWNPALNHVRIPVSARCEEFEVPARRLAALQVGDVLPLDATALDRVEVRLARVPKFVARLGSLGPARAVELTGPIKK